MSTSSSPRTEPATPAAFLPKVDSTFSIKKTTRNFFDAVDKKATEKGAINLMFSGPHGCGKTEGAIQFAARTNRPILIMDCAHTREAYLWFGRMHVKEGTTYFKESDFFKAVQAGGHVILLDELNRVDSSVLSTLMPLLDARRFTHVPDTEEILRMGDDTVVFATMNEGNEYTGTAALDAAIRDRFSLKMEVDYLPSADEIAVLEARTGIDKKDAAKLVAVANIVRAKNKGFGATLTQTISTRQLIACADLYKTIGNAAFEFAIANHFSAEGNTNSERKQVLEMIQGKFGI
jgi:nitric oxide reductase NorQ protein